MAVELMFQYAKKLNSFLKIIYAYHMSPKKEKKIILKFFNIFSFGLAFVGITFGINLLCKNKMILVCIC